MKRKIVKLKVKKKGQKPIEFKAGALRAQLGVKKDEKIPAGKMKAAEEGKMGLWLKSVPYLRKTY